VDFWRKALLLGVWVVLAASCGDTKTVSVGYTDSLAGNVSPNFIVHIFSDLSSNFRQSATPAVDERSTPANQSIYYYTAAPDNLKNCVLFEGLVTRVAGYHSDSASESDCTTLASRLAREPDGTSLFPIPDNYLAESGRSVKADNEGFVYTMFFYNTNASTGSSVAAGQLISSTNRCVKIWGARITGGQPTDTAGSAAATLDLKNLKCYGF
jgi:hypothetical protein